MNQKKAIDQPSNTNHSNKWDNLKTLITIISAVIAAVSCFFAWQALKSHERVVKINTYMNMRENFKEVTHGIPHEYFDENFPAPSKDEKVWRKISDYWYLSFDEWYLTTHLGDPNLKKLWDERYKHLLASQLERNAFREVVCYLIKEKFVQNDIQKKFGEELKTLYKEKTNKELCSN